MAEADIGFFKTEYQKILEQKEFITQDLLHPYLEKKDELIKRYYSLLRKFVEDNAQDIRPFELRDLLYKYDILHPFPSKMGHSSHIYTKLYEDIIKTIKRAA